MTVLFGLIYVIYFLLLGTGVRFAFNLFTKNQLSIESKTEYFAHAFFQGVFFHIVMFNILQLFHWPISGLLSLIGTVVLINLSLITWQFNSGLTVQAGKPRIKSAAAVLILVLIGSSLIYWTGHMLPNIAWDSWAVWEGKAEQWLVHGLHTDVVLWDQWILQNNALFNHAANYPDGLSLMYYLPKLIFNQGFAIMHVVNLFAFAMLTALLVSRVAKYGASIYLQIFMIMIIYTIPMINNHLMIQGYADIWMAMYLLLIMLTLMDYQETQHLGVGITLLCYLAILPLLKLEGWVWLLLFISSYLLVWLWQSKWRIWIWISLLAITLLIAFGFIDFSFKFGRLIINHERIVIFNLIDTPIQFFNITEQLLTSFFWQNNWSLIWLGLPFLIISFFTQRHDPASHIAQIFFITALLCFLFLFYFTEASQWALDFTAINRLVLQLTPCYLFLLFKMLAKIERYKPT